MIKNGKKINPLTQRITAQRKLTGEELARFYAERDRMRQNISGEVAYAKAEPLPEDRKLAYQGPSKSKAKKLAKTKKAKFRKQRRGQSGVVTVKKEPPRFTRGFLYSG